MFTIKGKVKGKDGAFGRREIFVHKRVDGTFLGMAVSDVVTGEYTFKTDYGDPVYLVCQPMSGELSNAQILDNVIPTWVDDGSAVNDIGVPGEVGFGVGVCPELPNTFRPLEGYLDKWHKNYGNYEHISDGSIVVWVPAFWFKLGTGTNGLTSNDIAIKPLNAYASDAAAATDGFVMHRAFIDDGVQKTGFFIDKYQNSKHPSMMVASSIKYGIPLVATDSALAPITLIPPYDGYAWNLVPAAQRRGSGWFCASIFMKGAIGMLSYAHGMKSLSTEHCAWYGSINNFPKGNGNYLYSDKDASLRFLVAKPAANTNSYFYGFTGSCVPFNRNTHNGMESGIADIVGNTWEFSPGMSYINGNFRAPQMSFKMSTASAATTGAAFFSPDANGLSVIIGPELGSAMTATQFYYYNTNVTMFSGSTDKASPEYIMDCIMIPSRSGSTVSGTNPNNVGGAIYYSKTNYSFPIWGGGGDSFGNEGIISQAWADTNVTRTPKSFRSGFYT